MKVSELIVNEIQKYKSLTSLGIALEGMIILNKIDRLLDQYKLNDLRDTISEWLFDY